MQQMQIQASCHWPKRYSVLTSDGRIGDELSTIFSYTVSVTAVKSPLSQVPDIIVLSSLAASMAIYENTKYQHDMMLRNYNFFKVRTKHYLRCGTVLATKNSSQNSIPMIVRGSIVTFWFTFHALVKRIKFTCMFQKRNTPKAIQKRTSSGTVSSESFSDDELSS